MKQSVLKLARFSARRKYLVISVATLIIFLIFLCLSWFTIQRNDRYILSSIDQATQSSINTAIVFGGGIRNDKPLPLLQERLDTAVTLYRNASVRKLLVSGDNRTTNYNEPQVMKQYLLDQSIPEEAIQLDNAGRSTYETCERARAIFQLDQAILISEPTHLPRAIYLCRSFGVSAVGYPSKGRAYEALKDSQGLREIMARAKAVLNVYVYGERTLLGEPIPLP